MTSPPADSIRRLMQAHDMTLLRFTALMCLDAGVVVGLLDATIAIDAHIAARLVAVFGGQVEFWLSRERCYREDLAEDLASDLHPSRAS